MSRVDNFIEENPSPARLRRVVQGILNALNLGIEFGSPTGTKPPGTTVNIKGAWQTGQTPGVADQEFAVTHNLGYVPVGFIPFSVDQSAVLYKGVTAWTSKQIFLKCHQTAVNYTIFIL